MKPAAKALLEKLLRTRPKPDERAMRELFMAIKATPIQDLMAMIGGSRGGGKVAQALPAELEAEVKRQLRKVGGKAADFVPYLLDAINARSSDQPVPSTKGLTLGKALSMAVDHLGPATQAAVDEALRAYVSENDVSYRLKSA